MGCIYSIYSVEDRKLIAILNECNATNTKNFILMREALKLKKTAYINRIWGEEFNSSKFNGVTYYY